MEGTVHRTVNFQVSILYCSSGSVVRSSLVVRQRDSKHRTDYSDTAANMRSTCGLSRGCTRSTCTLLQRSKAVLSGRYPPCRMRRSGRCSQGRRAKQLRQNRYASFASCS